jgi:hypothetical protein
MKRLLGGLFETVHLLGAAVLFAAAALLTALSTPALLRALDLSTQGGARVFERIGHVVTDYGTWLGGAALLCGLLAPYVRSDGNKVLAWTRILLSGVAVGCVVSMIRLHAGPGVFEADVETASDVAREVAKGERSVTPWNALAVCTGLNLFLAAFQIQSPEKHRDR